MAHIYFKYLNELIVFRLALRVAQTIMVIMAFWSLRSSGGTGITFLLMPYVAATRIIYY